MGDAPHIRDVGLEGLLITFSETLTDAGNRAALALRSLIKSANWPGVIETASTLTSTFVRYDPETLPRAALVDRVQDLLASQDWNDAPMPNNRRLLRIPVVLGGEEGPQFDAAIEAAGLTETQATEDVANTRLRVLTLGFAPGQAYLGSLPEPWNNPRLTNITPQVPQGALVTAIRQLIIFARPAPTGWLHIGQTAFRSYQPDAKRPFPLAPGDEVQFEPTSARDLPKLWDDPMGGARIESVP